VLRNRTGRHLREQLSGQTVWTVVRLAAEVFGAAARLYRDRQLTAHQVRARLGMLGRLPIEGLPINRQLSDMAWALRRIVTARDVLYAAGATALDARLMTTDRRLVPAVADIACTPDNA
jgi:predicted nucleic acid-binding protein